MNLEDQWNLPSNKGNEVNSPLTLADILRVKRLLQEGGQSPIEDRLQRELALDESLLIMRKMVGFDVRMN